jgi:hypothetical protein
MRKKHYHWTVQLTGMVLLGTVVSAEQDLNTYLQSTNHITLSLRFGLNIRSQFSGLGSSFGSGGGSAGNGRFTPNGDQYNYYDGYVLPDSTGNALGYSTYWGYDRASQYNQALNQFTFHQITATGISSAQSGDEDSQNAYPGLELTYDREFGKKENWHDMHYGLEGAVNFMKITLNNNSTSGATVTTTPYVYNFGGIAGSQPAPGYQGPYSPPPPPIIGIPVIVVPPSPGIPASSPGTFFSQDQFNGDLWGFRLGPYLDFPMSEKWSLHLSGGLALGLLDDNEAWQQTLNTGAGTLTASGQGTDFKMLWGYYVSLDAAYQINKRWGVEGGVQYEDIGQYSHSFSGRTVQLDLSQSLFVQVGISYSF